MKHWLSAVVVLVYTWAFLWADKSKLFLHYHYGWGPGNFVTDSRYSVFGLVFSGILTIFLYLLTKFKKIKRINITFKEIILAATMAGILMLLSMPIISLRWVMVSIICLIIGLFLGKETINIFLKCEGIKIFVPFILVSTPFLILFHSVELVSKGKVSPATAYGVAVVVMLVSIVGNRLINFIYKKKRIVVDYKDVLVVTLAMAYLIMPVVHFIFLTPRGVKYISTWDNFLAQKFFLQLGVIIMHYLIIKFSRD